MNSLRFSKKKLSTSVFFLFQKRSYVLLEVMIALVLVCLCLLPLALNPIKTLQKEIEMLEEIEYERIAEITFMQIKEMLLKNEIPWEDLSTSQKVKKKNNLAPVFLSLPGFYEKKIERAFKIYCPHEKEGMQSTIYRHILLSIELFNQAKKTQLYEYHLFAQKQMQK